MRGIDGWQSSPLGNICSLIKDGSHGTHQDVSEGLPFLSAKDVRDGLLQIPEDCRRISIKDYESIHKSYAIKHGDILLTIVGTIGRSCMVTGAEPRFSIQRSVGVIRSAQIMAEYLYQYIKSESFQTSLRDATNASAQGGVYLGSLAKCSVLYPKDPAEQTKIAEILSTVDRAIEQTEALIAKQQRIKAGLMQDLLTRGIDEQGKIRSEETHQFKDSPLGRIPKDWKYEPVGCHLRTIEQGWSPDCENVSAALGQWGVLKTTSVIWDGFQYRENKLLPHHLEPRKRYEVRVGDVLMTRAGPNSRVGVVAYVYETQPKLMLSDKLYRLIPDVSIDTEFLVLSLASDRTQKYLSTLKTGLAESQTNISQDIVRQLQIPLPLKSEQILIAKVIRSATERLNSDMLQLAKMSSLKTALMQDLLTGKRRVTALLPKHEEASA